MSYLWKALGIPEPHPEFKFHPTRKWRFDLAWPDHKIALEIEGGIWTGGRHSRGGIGFLKDMEKYNEAGKLGWRIFRCTPTEFKKGIAQSYIKEVFEVEK